MSRGPLSEINKNALSHVGTGGQPKVMGLFTKTEVPPEAAKPKRSQPAVEAKRAKPVKASKAVRKPAATVKRRPDDVEAAAEEPQMANFFASIPVQTIETLEDAVIRVKRRSGIRSFSRADVADAMFQLFAEIADKLELHDAPRKAMRLQGPFRTSLKNEAMRVLRKP